MADTTLPTIATGGAVDADDIMIVRRDADTDDTSVTIAQLASAIQAETDASEVSADSTGYTHSTGTNVEAILDDFDTAIPASSIANVVDDTTPQLGGDLDVNSKRILGGTGTSIGTSDVTSSTLTLPSDGNTFLITQSITFDKIANDLADGSVFHLICDSGGTGTTLTGGLRLVVKTESTFGLGTYTMQRGDVATFIRNGDGLGSPKYDLINLHKTTLLPTGVFNYGGDIASAASLPVTGDSDSYNVTGTTSANTISYISVGKRVYIRTAAAMTFVYNAVTFNNFPADASITTKAGDILTFTQIDDAVGSVPYWRLDAWRGKSGELRGYSDKQTYTVTNDVVDRTFDANSTSVAELADVLATLLLDLESYGVLTKS